MFKKMRISLSVVLSLTCSGSLMAQQDGYWQQAQQQQQQMQQEQQRQNELNQRSHDPVYACVNGRDIYGQIGNAACASPSTGNNGSGSSGGSAGGSWGTVPKVTIVNKYGAVATNEKKDYLTLLLAKAPKMKLN